MAAAQRRGWDVHAHLIPPAVLAAAKRGQFGLRLVGDELAVDGHPVPTAMLGHAERLEEDLAAAGLEGALVSLPPVLYRYDLMAGEAATWATFVNDSLAEVAEASQGRIRVLGHIPLPHAEQALEEMPRIDEEPFVGLAIGTSPGGMTLDNARFEPFLAAADAGGWFVFIHPMDAPDARLGDFYLGNLLGNPYETALATARLIFSDIPGRFDGITFCLAHAGGAVPSLVGRWEKGVATKRPGIGPLSLSPREAMRRLYADSIAHDPWALRLLSATVGVEHVLLGSDWPFPMGDADPGSTVGTIFTEDWQRQAAVNLRRALGHRHVLLDEVRKPG